MKIPFNKPFLTGKEAHYIYQAVNSGKISGNGIFTHKCQKYFEKRYGFKKCLMTTSCTDSLEMISILIDIKQGDEVIVPSYTFSSTANAFVLRGAKIVFADSSEKHPNIDINQIEKLITKKTKAIVVVHYAGNSCDMDAVMDIANKYNLFVVEDAAQAIDSYYKGKPLGGIGHFGAFSFHETKNIISGEGGMLVINDERFFKRSEIIWEKGTNRAAFSRGEIDKYDWVDIGSSFLPSELVSAFLFAQLENLEEIQAARKRIWFRYMEELSFICDYKGWSLNEKPNYSSNNAHVFYILCPNNKERSNLINYLKKKEILTVFHYQSLHKSSFYSDKHDGRKLVNSENFENNLLRLPLYYDLSESNQREVTMWIKNYFNEHYLK